MIMSPSILPFVCVTAEQRNERTLCAFTSDVNEEGSALHTPNTIESIEVCANSYVNTMNDHRLHYYWQWLTTWAGFFFSSSKLVYCVERLISRGHNKFDLKRKKYIMIQKTYCAIIIIIMIFIIIIVAIHSWSFFCHSSSSVCLDTSGIYFLYQSLYSFFIFGWLLYQQYFAHSPPLASNGVL